MDDRLAKLAAEIIKEIKYVTIASVCADGKPWNSPVYSSFDNDLNFYWFSDKDSQHSTNVRATGEAFLVIYNSTVPEGTGKGVYLQCKVRELTDENEVMAAKQVCDSRIGKTKDHDFSKYSGDAPLRGYQATPYKTWMNSDEVDTEGQYIKDIRVEIALESLKGLL